MLRASMVIVAAMMSFGTACCMHAQQPSGAKTKRPTLFAPDDENRGFKGSVPPSDAVLDALLATDEAKESREGLSGHNREYARELFQAVRIDIGDAAEEAYIVEGSWPMSGADNIWFWIVRVVHDKAHVLLFTNGLTVTILSHRTNGYRDIKEEWGGNAGWGSRVYQYSGSRYKLVRKRWQDAKP